VRLAPDTAFRIFSVAGYGLLYFNWLQSVDTAGFVLLLLLGILFMARYRLLVSRWTVLVDFLFILAFYMVEGASSAQFGVGFVLFQGMFAGLFPLMLLPLGLLAYLDGFSVVIIAFSGAVGLALFLWEKEYTARLLQRDNHAIKLHEMELLQMDLTNALAKVEQMSILTERSRISADIHDNAGHEIVASYISLQTVQKIIDKNPEKAYQLFEKSMARLNAGIGKMRDAVHNIAAVTFMGVDTMRDICLNFAKVPVTFHATGDVSGVTVNSWHVLESVLKESLTNAVKHAAPSYIRVELDATRRLIRLQVQNDGLNTKEAPTGSGLRNLRYRVVTVGGNLTVDKTDVYKLVCVIPIR